MWEQRNGIVHETLHPHRLAQLLALQQTVCDRFQEGCDTLLPRDQQLFAKGLDTLLKKGSDCEMNQWMTPVMLTRQRSSSAREDYEASLRSERALMQSWLRPVTWSGQDKDTTSGQGGCGAIALISGDIILGFIFTFYWDIICLFDARRASDFAYYGTFIWGPYLEHFKVHCFAFARMWLWATLSLTGFKAYHRQSIARSKY
jgi:hypothetical protein